MGFGIKVLLREGERGVGVERGHVDCVFCVREKESSVERESDCKLPTVKGIFGNSGLKLPASSNSSGSIFSKRFTRTYISGNNCK